MSTDEAGTASGMIVYKYGCPSWADLDEAAIGQLRLANELWNDLVAAERAHQEKVAEIWAAHPDVALFRKAADEAAADTEAIAEEMRRHRQRDQSTKPRPAGRERLAAARAARKQARAALKAAKDAAMQCAACTVQQALLDAQWKRDGRKGKPPWVPPADCTCEAQGKARILLAQAKRDCRACTVRLTSADASFYKEYCGKEEKGKGLGWATFNDVSAHFKTALARIGAQRQEGTAADLKFHRFGGTGTLTVQVQRESGDPVPSPGVLASGTGKWRNTVHLSADPVPRPPRADGRPRRREPKGSPAHRALSLRLTAGCRITLPVIVHREMPPDAEIKEVKLTRRVTGGSARLSVAFACRIPAAARRTEGATVALRLKWEQAGGGVLHAGVIRSDLPLGEPPAGIAPFVRMADGCSADVFLPPELRFNLRAPKEDAASPLDRGSDLARVTRIRQHRDENLDILREAVCAILRQDPPAAELAGVTAADVSRWRAPWRFAKLAAQAGTLCTHPGPCHPPRTEPGRHCHETCTRGAHRCHERCFASCHPLAAELGHWRKRDRHLWAYEANERGQVIARRRDTYRKLAEWACRDAKTVIIDDLPVAALRRRPGIGQEDPVRDRRARASATAAAPGELAAAFRSAAARRGIGVNEYGEPGTPGEREEP
jgi:hypothetical protein